jgi:glycosyltransferase involved in cell wall biosynthesis/phospholipid N-methyltransferase
MSREERKLSILVPLYNEEEFIAAVLDRVLAAPLPHDVSREIIVVDDGSRDGSPEIVERYASQYAGLIRLIRHARNQGKGAAIRTAIEHATGEFSIIQDADLEYDPSEYMAMLKPILDGRADAVFGSRFASSAERRVLYFWHSLANRALTACCNMLADLNLTDMETCYKAFRTSLVQSIPIRSNRFGIEPELTIKLARRQARIYEVPISYHGRTYAEGKKIGLKDAFEAAYVMAKTAMSSDIYKDSGPETLEALSYAPRFNTWMAETILPYIGESVLEIGAGIGNLTPLLIKRRKRYIASDIDPHHMARLCTRFAHRPNFEARYCDLTETEHFTDLAEQVDSIVCLNVLEHVSDDATALRNMYGALSPGGRAIILVPQGQELYGTLDQALGRYRRYSIPELQHKMQSAGFVVERILTFNRISRPAWYFSGTVLKRTAFSTFQMRVFDRLVWIWRRMDGLLPWPSTSIIAIGAKPTSLAVIQPVYAERNVSGRQ